MDLTILNLSLIKTNLPWAGGSKVTDLQAKQKQTARHLYVQQEANHHYSVQHRRHHVYTDKQEE